MKPNTVKQVNEIPIVAYRSLDQFCKREKWDHEEMRINAMKCNLMQLENLLSNSKYIQSLFAVSNRTRKEIGIDGQNHFVNVLVNNVNSPPIFRYSLVRTWYYLMNNYEFMVKFMTTEYENVTINYKEFHDIQINDVCGILFKYSEVMTPYISYVKVGDSIYRITTSELLVLSVIRITQMWYTNVMDEAVIVLSTHGIKDHHYPKIKEKIIKKSIVEVMSGEFDSIKMIEEGILFIKGSSFTGKMNIIKSLTGSIKDCNKVVTEVILNNEFVKMVIQESFRPASSESKIAMMCSLISMMKKHSYSDKLNMRDILSIAIISDDPIKLLNDVLIAYKSRSVVEICEAISLPFELSIDIESSSIVPRVVDVVLHSIVNKFNDNELLLDCFLKLKVILEVENCDVKLDDKATVISKWQTKIPIRVINMVIDFAYEKFIEPHFEGTFDYDLNKFDLVTQFN